MYKQRDDVKLLIDSLAMGEKRAFTNRFINDISGDSLPLYLRMYIELEKGRSQLSNDFDAFGSRTITAAKRRLYDNIIDTLLSQHKDHSANIVLQNQLSAIELLYGRGLAEQALIIWDKAYRLATGQEKFSLLLQLLDWEKRINIVLDTPTRTSDDIKDEEDTTIAKLRQILVLERLYSHIMLFKKKHGFAKGILRTQLERETIHSDEMPRYADCLSEKALYYFNLIHAVYYWMVFDHRQGYLYSKKLMLESAGNILPNDFIVGIMQHITSSVCLAKFNDTLDGISMGNAYLEQYGLVHSTSFRSLMFAYQATYRIISYNYMGKHKKLVQTIQETEAQLQQYNSFLPLEVKRIVMGNLMNAYMGINDLDRADKMWQMINDKHFRNVREDINGDLYLFRLFMLLAQKQYVLLPSAALSASRYYNKSTDAKALYAVELPIARLLLKDRDYERAIVLGDVMGQIKDVVSKYITALAGNIGFQEHYSRYVIWCDAIIKGEAFYVAALRWFSGYKKSREDVN